jgi:hypothetical protein
MKIPGLRASRESVGGIVFFGRTLDKIRLHAAGKLPPDYNRGYGFDRRVCRFLNIDYEALVLKALAEPNDIEVLAWCFDTGRRPSDEEIFVFNAFMVKRGWRDDISAWVVAQKEIMGLFHREDIQTAFDIHDADEAEANNLVKQ